VTSNVADYDETAALIVTDIQNDFADSRGSLHVQGGQEVVPIANVEIRRAGEAGSLVAYTQDWHPPSTPHFQKDGGIWPVHCVQNTWGAEFHPGLQVTPDAEIVRKGTGGEDGYSGFSVRDPTSGERSATRLEALLRDRGIRRLVVIGLATDYCVKETVLDGVALGLECLVVTAAVRAVDLKPGDGARALEDLRRAGAHVE
jgi:nicotinamidase/pyrazinamidase